VVTTVSTSGPRPSPPRASRRVRRLDALATALNANDAAGVLATVNSLDGAPSRFLPPGIDAGLKLGKLDPRRPAPATHIVLATEQHGLVDSNPAEAYTRLIQAAAGARSGPHDLQEPARRPEIQPLLAFLGRRFAPAPRGVARFEPRTNRSSTTAADFSLPDRSSEPPQPHST